MLPGCERFAAGLLLILKTSGRAAKAARKKLLLPAEAKQAAGSRLRKTGRLSPGQRTAPFRAAGRQCRREAVSLLF